MGPNVWGSIYWAFIHFACYYLDSTYSHQRQEAWQADVKRLFDGVDTALPCNTCRHHFREFARQVSVPTGSKGVNDPSLLRWSIQAHNNVNKMHNKALADEDFVVNLYKTGRPIKPGLASPTSPDQLNQSNHQAGWSSWLGWMLAVIMLVVVLIVIAWCFAEVRRVKALASIASTGHTVHTGHM
jgi:hypothetical protein